MRYSEKSLAYALLRVAIGVNFAGHGLVRLFVIGLGPFAHGAADRLSKSPLPHSLTLSFLYVVPFVETLAGIALILGLMTRTALTLCSLLMIGLLVGVTSNQQWDVAGQQLLYALVLFVLFFYWEHNELSLDAVIRRRS